MRELLTLILMIGLSVLTAQKIDGPLITVEETVVGYAPVDEIHFSLVVNSYDLDIQQARLKNKIASQKVFDFLAKKNIPERFIQTQAINISRHYPRGNQRDKYEGFDATQSIYVCLENIDAYDAVIDGLLTMDIERINGPYFKSSQYEKVKEEAQLLAIKQAKDKAEKMANVLNQTVGRPFSIKDKTNFQSSSNFEYASGGAGNQNDNSGKAFAVGEIKVLANVEVAFYLLDKN